MLSDVRAVIFDLDGTLLDRRRSFEEFVRDQWERFAHVLKAVDRELYVQTLIERDRDGYAPREELFAGIIAHFTLSSLDGDAAGRLPRRLPECLFAECSPLSTARHPEDGPKPRSAELRATQKFER